MALLILALGPGTCFLFGPRDTRYHEGPKLGVGPSLVIDVNEYDYRTMPQERVPYFEVRDMMPSKASDFFHEVVLRRGSLELVSVVSRVERRSSHRDELG